MAMDHYEDDDDKDMKDSGAKGGTDFDCPSCTANNPLDEALADGQEIRCHYCGGEFKVIARDGGRFKFREI